MSLLGCQKDRRVITRFRYPHAVENPQPHVGKIAQGNRMALAFCPLALAVRFGSRFLRLAGPGKLVQRVAHRLEAGMTAMDFLVVPALIENRSGASQYLEVIARGIPTAIISQ